jgi:hypothetical protein
MTESPTTVDVLPVASVEMEEHHDESHATYDWATALPTDGSGPLSAVEAATKQIAS